LFVSIKKFTGKMSEYKCIEKKEVIWVINC
jgi:hypothetical protein